MRRIVKYLTGVVMFLIFLAGNIRSAWAADIDWANVTDAELKAYIESGQVNYGSSDLDLYERLQAYYNNSVVPERDKVNSDIEAQARRDALIPLSSTSGAHGIVTDKMIADSRVYKGDGYSYNSPTREKYSDATIDLSKSEDISANVEKDSIFDMVMKLLGKLLYFIANSVDKLLSAGGMGLDNIIFGRVGGNGVQLKGVGNNPIVSFFTFELTEGNPYGVVAAILFQKIREYAYLFAVIYCLWKMIKVGLPLDYERAKMERQTFIENTLLCFSMMVFMPYLLDFFLYIKDLALKGITIATLDELFASRGFLDAFRKGAENYDLIPCILYLGAVIASLMFAAIYVTYAMSMLVHFVLFPAVCVRAIGDKRVLGEWVSEAVGLTIMPLIDGILLMIPLTFSSFGDGVIVMQLLSLISCAVLLIARRQARRSLGIRDNSALENGALASVMGATQLAKGVARGFRRSVGRMTSGIKEVRADKGMAKYYQEQASEEGWNDGGAIEAPTEGASEVPTYQEAQAAGVDGSGTPLYESAPDMTVEAPGTSSAGEKEVYASAKVLENVEAADNAMSGTGMMGSQGISNPDPIAEKYANVNNFEDSAFRGKLSNERMAQLYKQRARKTLLKSVGSSTGALAGGIAGGTVGFAAGAFMGNSMQSYLTGTGVDVGSSTGGAVGEGAVSVGMGAVKGVKGAYSKSMDKIAFESARCAAMGTMEHYSDGEIGSGIRVQQAGDISETAQTEEQSMEHRKAAVKNFFSDNEGKNYMSYSADVTEAASAAEKIVPYTFSEEERRDIVEKLNAAKEAYEKTEMKDADTEAYNKRIAVERNRVNEFKRENLRNTFTRSLDNDANADFDKNNQVHQDAFSATMVTAERKLQKPHRLFSDEYTRDYMGIDFLKY